MKLRSAQAFYRFLLPAGLAGLVAIAVVAATHSARPPALLYYGTQSGDQTFDADADGGNPFASALIEALARPRLGLAELGPALRELTSAKSSGQQTPEVPLRGVSASWPLLLPAADDSRIALVLVVSDYAMSGGAPSLPGVRHDAQRVTFALRQAGFVTEIALDLDLKATRQRLAAFRERSWGADTALVYSTGHGVEVGGQVFLLPGDYPTGQRNAALTSRAIRLAEVVEAAQARRANLVLYAGCRDNPFGN